MKIDHYAYWKAALAGEKPKMFVDDPQCGFYRKAVKRRDERGNNKHVGWEPVAIFLDVDGTIVALIGSSEVYADAVNELWSYVAGNAISESLYRDVAENGGAWPDAKTSVPAADREVTAADNTGPEQPLDVQHATAIDNAIAAAITTVTNETEAAQALGSKNRIAELRLAADKAGKAIYDPIYRQYTAEQKKWSPIVARATAKEKELNTELLKFRERERLRIAAEQAEADRKQREIEEANQRAADRAIAAGEPEPEPVVETVDAPVFEPTPIQPTYGTRKLQEKLHKFVVIDDLSAVFAKFKNEPRVVELLTTLAQAEINSGRNVPGTHVREGLI